MTASHQVARCTGRRRRTPKPGMFASCSTLRSSEGSRSACEKSCPRFRVVGVRVWKRTEPTTSCGSSVYVSRSSLETLPRGRGSRSTVVARAVALFLAPRLTSPSRDMLLLPYVVMSGPSRGSRRKLSAFATCLRYLSLPVPSLPLAFPLLQPSPPCIESTSNPGAHKSHLLLLRPSYPRCGACRPLCLFFHSSCFPVVGWLHSFSRP